jgi:putative transposase
MKYRQEVVWPNSGPRENQQIGRAPRFKPCAKRLVQPRLYAYVAHKAGELGVFLYALGGTEDHMHIVPAIPPKHSVAWVVKMLKGASAHFVNTELRPPGLYFAWQRGYGSLTVGERQRAAAIDYVLRQKEHHQQQTTNAWLERCDDEESEGEAGRSSPASPDSHVLLETMTDYEVVLDLPW